MKDKKILPKLTQDDVDLIKMFLSEIEVTSETLTVKRKYKYAYVLVHWRAYIGEYRKNTSAELYKGISALKETKDGFGNPRYSTHTLADYVGFLKRFYLWLIDNKYSEIEEKKVRKIKRPAVTLMTKTAEQLLTEEEVRKMIESCTNSRDRAILATMYEGGFRIGEIASLHWHQLKFNEWNVAVNVDNKTRKPRYIPLIMARPYLATWRNDYPGSIMDSGHVFLTFGQNEALTYCGFRKQLDKIARSAGITKHVTPHIFRHSRITHLIRKGFGESMIKLMMWGDINSDMFKAYAHLTNNDLDEEVALHAGITLPDQKNKSKALEPRQCMSCYLINEPGVNFCGNCGMPLTPEAGNRLTEAKQQARLLPDYDAVVEDYNRRIKQAEFIAPGMT